LFKNQARIKAQHLIWLKSERLNSFLNLSLSLQNYPYNAPPLTRNNGKQAAGSAGFNGEITLKPTEKSKISA
jgi:hypothetical protein